MKRWLYAAAFVVAAVAATGAGAPPAQGIERPAARPTLSITVTDGGIWTWPALEAGSYRVTIDNLTERPADLLFVRVPEGWSAERYAAADAWELDAARLFGDGFSAGADGVDL